MQTTPALSSLALLVLLIGCGQTEQLSAQDELTLAAISGEEEDLAEGSVDLMPSDADAQPMFRPCDAEGALASVLATYDGDGDGTIGPDEEDAVLEDREGGPAARHRARRWEGLAFIYDSDDSGDLAEAERAGLLADFTERCTAIHARILEEFDADADGELSEEERAAAREARESRRMERGEDGECNRGGDAPDGTDPGGEVGQGGPAAGGTQGGGTGGELRGPAAFTADMTDEELAAFREEAREAIRSGAPRPFGPRDADELD